MELYIKQLAKDYYSAFFSNNPLAFERTLANLNIIEFISSKELEPNEVATVNEIDSHEGINFSEFDF